MMQTKKSSKPSAASRTVSITLPATVGSVSKTQRARRQNKRGGQAVAAPVSFGIRTVTGRPTITPSPGADGRIRVRHREFVMDVKTTLAFTVVSLPLNPAQESTFPWLSAIARGYESYRFNSLRFDYVPSVGTSTAGAVALAIDYDCLDPLPLQKAELMQMHGAARSTFWDTLTLQADKPDLSKMPQRYTRKSAWSGNGDLKTYDVGNLFVGTVGGENAGQLAGEIYVTYDVELITPQAVIYSPDEYSLEILRSPGGDGAKPLGAVTKEVTGTKYNGATGALLFSRLGTYLLNLGAGVDQVDYGNAVWGLTGLNVTADLLQKSWDLDHKVVQSLYEITVDALPATLVPVINGLTTAIGPAALRLAPFAKTLPV